MPPIVVNVKVAHLRNPSHGVKKCDNLRDWISLRGNVYIGRPRIVLIDGNRFPQASDIPVDFSNPFKVGDDNTLEQSLSKYYRYLRYKLHTDQNFYDNFMELRKAKFLGCWCKPNACHGDVILEVLRELVSS